MHKVHFVSEPRLVGYPKLAERLADLSNRSVAMGLSTGPALTGFDPGSVRRLVSDLQQHGFAGMAGTALAPLLRDDDPAVWDDATTQALQERLDQVAEALEASPAPAAEWPAVRAVLGDELLGALVGVSASSLRRYAAGERDTPLPIATRLHWLALVVADLAGAYNSFGIRRWFDRPRAQLDGRSPRAFIGEDWDADGAPAGRVRALARALTGAQGLAV